MVELKRTNESEIEDDDEEEEPGEVIESAPPLRVGQEREISSSGRRRLRLKKQLLNCGIDWETSAFGDEVTVHYTGSLLDGTKFVSTRDADEPFTFKLGHGRVASGLHHRIITMKKGKLALFALPREIGGRCMQGWWNH